MEKVHQPEVESFDKDDSFHINLQQVMLMHGKVVSINWVPRPANGPWVGIVILFAYGALISRRFAVFMDQDKYKLNILGRSYNFESDYFA